MVHSRLPAARFLITLLAITGAITGSRAFGDVPAAAVSSQTAGNPGTAASSPAASSPGSTGSAAGSAGASPVATQPANSAVQGTPTGPKSTVTLSTAIGGPAPQLLVATTSDRKVSRDIHIESPTTLPTVNVTSAGISRLDGAAVIPAKNIIPTIRLIRAHTPTTLPITFDLSGVAAGEYVGSVLVSFGPNAPAIGVPVTIRIRHGGILPGLLLVLGIALGMALTAYRRVGRRRDQTILRAARVRRSLQDDAQLAGSAFGLRINVLLGQVSEHSQSQFSEDVEKAERAITDAEAIAGRWRENRSEWLRLMALSATFDDTLAKLDAPGIRRAVTTAVQAYRDALAAAWEPDKLAVVRANADAVVTLVNAYDAAKRELDALSRRVGDEDPKVADFQQQLHSTTAVESLHKLADTIRAELDKRASKEANAGALETVSSSSDILRIRLEGPLQPDLDPRQVARARCRLKWFMRTSYTVAVVFLAAAGFSELYLAKLTFGANPVVDYLAVFAYGFGAEATRASVTNTVRGWGLVGLQ